MIIIRIWHQKLIPYLPRQQLLGQHRELAALRGKGWGKKHATVDYVFTNEPANLVAYHWLVMDEMKRRGYKPDELWWNADYRGTTLGIVEDWCDYYAAQYCHGRAKENGSIIYSEHNDAYFRECIENLRAKGVDVAEMEKLL